MSKAKNEENREPDDFESCLERLEELVRALESGDKGLEESLALFEKGVTLSKDLSQRLENAKTKVEALSRSDGKLVKKPFAETE